MTAAIAIFAMLLLAVAFGFTVRELNKSHSTQIESYRLALEVEQLRVNALLMQMQANAQGLQHYPTYGPQPPLPEEKFFLRDETGLVEVEYDPEDAADFDEFSVRVGA